MSDRLSGVAVFVEAVEAGSFAAAASRLHLSRSAVGKAVAKLETRLGTRLFHRTTRTQSLTEDGQAFYESCLKALAEIRAAEDMLDSGKREAAGRLCISLPVLFGRRCAAPVLVTLARQYPKLAFDLSFSDRPVDLVEEGFDLAIRNGPIGSGDGLIARRLANQRMTVCAAPDYLAIHGPPLSLDDLARHVAVTYGRGGMSKGWLFPQGAGAPRQAVPPSRLRLDDLDAIADAGAAGLGLVWLPCWLVHDRIQRGELIHVLTDQPMLEVETHALWPRNPHMPYRLRVTIDALAANLSTLPD